MKKNNILIIAYACEPNSASEPGVGWNFSQEIAKNSNVWVVTRSNNRDVIEKEMNHRQNTNINWVYVDLPTSFRWLKKKMPLGIQFYYMLWQWKVFFKCKKLTKKYNFTLIHHLTFGITWLAPTTSLLKLPFVWGPVGGGDAVPLKYILSERLPSIAQESLYFFLSRIICRLSLLNYIARKRSKAILFRSKSVESHFPKTTAKNRYIISETASRTLRSTITEKTSSFQALCVGRQQYWKGYRYAVEGFCKFLSEGGTGTLLLLGDGPENEILKKIHQSYGSPNEIKFLGNVPHKDVLSYLESSSTLIHPSFRDGGSWAVLEALSHSIPVITQNVSGTADMVTNKCGILLDTNIRLDDAIASALHRLSNDRHLLDSLSAGAIERVKNSYTWEKRCQEINEIYQDIWQPTPTEK